MGWMQKRHRTISRRIANRGCGEFFQFYKKEDSDIGRSRPLHASLASTDWRSTRVISPRTRTAARWSAVSNSCAGCFAAPAMAKYVVAEKLPGPSVQSNDELLDYARANGSTVYHASCSCVMGQHAMAVVDDQLRVHGAESLRVIDASVMAAVTSTNTDAPTIIIDEKGAAIIKGAARQRLAA